MSTDPGMEPEMAGEPEPALDAEASSLAFAEMAEDAGELAGALKEAAVVAKDLASATSENLSTLAFAAAGTLPPPSLFAATDNLLIESLLSSARLVRRTAELERHVQLSVMPRTRSGVRLQSLRGRMGEVALDDVRPDDAALSNAAELLRREGLVVERIGRFGITVSGPARLVSSVLKTKLAIGATPRTNAGRATRLFSSASSRPLASDLFVAPRQSLTISAKHLGASLDDFVFVPRPLLFAPAQRAPAKVYHHLDEAGIRRLLDVPRLPSGKLEWDGSGVKVAMVDTGFDTSHPYYIQNGLRLRAVSIPGAPNAHLDSHGHGTAMAWNVFAVAPACEVLGFKSDSLADAIEEASERGADIISCSWGFNYEQSFPQLEATIKDVIEQDGRIVVFSSGNGHYAWPGSMPQVLSVGGVHADASSALQASNYASGFMSSLYPARRVPDFSGLCGQTPSAVYLPLPVPEGCEMDIDLAQSYPEGDETASDDGWVYASGTSAAAPQVAGVAALMVQKAKSLGKTLDGAQVRKYLEQSALPVTAGHNAQGIPAVGHPNAAVGYGLVQAAQALGLV